MGQVQSCKRIIMIGEKTMAIRYGTCVINDNFWSKSMGMEKKKKQKG